VTDSRGVYYWFALAFLDDTELEAVVSVWIKSAHAPESIAVSSSLIRSWHCKGRTGRRSYCRWMDALFCRTKRDRRLILTATANLDRQSKYIWLYVLLTRLAKWYLDHPDRSQPRVTPLV
jgi:hypothetical protein